MRKYRIAYLLFLSTFCIAFLLNCKEKDHPKDSELIANFQNHKDEFNQLLRIFEEDESLGRVANDFTRRNFYEKAFPKNWDGKEIEASEERLYKYRNLFRKLNLSAGIEGYGEKNLIVFHASTQGLSVTGSSKGYAYILEEPTILTDSLDEYQSKDGRSFTAFRHIEGNWYLYFDYED